MVPDQMPAIEGEFAFRLGRDLPPRKEEYSYDEVRDAIEAAAGAIEIVGTRIAGGLAGKGRFLVTADGGANIALVTGPWLDGLARVWISRPTVSPCRSMAEMAGPAKVPARWAIR